MTKLQALGLFSSAHTPELRQGSVGKPGLARMACMVFLFCTAAAIAASAQTFKTVFTFDGTNGDAPSGALVQARDGNFYGVTLGGGVSPVCGGGCGTVFKITPAGTLTTLHSFCSLTNCADGENP